MNTESATIADEELASKLPYRIILVDDHPILRQGVAQLLGQEKDLTVCGQFEDITGAMKGINALKPDAVIVDISLKGSNGLDLVKTLKAETSGIAVLVLSMHDEAIYAERALRAGATGYIMKQESPEQLLLAVRKVLRGEVYLSPTMNSKLMLQFLSGQPLLAGSSLERLSDRELEIFNLIGEGRSTRDIAAKLQLSSKTVETHRTHIKEKLQLKNSTELVHRAVQLRAE